MKDLRRVITLIQNTQRLEFQSLRALVEKGRSQGTLSDDLDTTDFTLMVQLYNEAEIALGLLSIAYQKKQLTRLEHAAFIIPLIQLRTSLFEKISPSIIVDLPTNEIPASQEDMRKFHLLQVLYAFIAAPKSKKMLIQLWEEMPGKTTEAVEHFNAGLAFFDKLKTPKIRWLSILSILDIIGSTLYTIYMYSTENGLIPSSSPPPTSASIEARYQTQHASNNVSDFSDSSSVGSSSHSTFSDLFVSLYLPFSILLPLILGISIIATLLFGLSLSRLNKLTTFFLENKIRDLINTWKPLFPIEDNLFFDEITHLILNTHAKSMLPKIEAQLIAIASKPLFPLIAEIDPLAVIIDMDGIELATLSSQDQPTPPSTSAEPARTTSIATPS